MHESIETTVLALIACTLIALGVWVYTAGGARRHLGSRVRVPIAEALAAGIPFGAAVLVHLVASKVPSKVLVDLQIGIGTALVFVGMAVMTWRPRWLLPKWVRDLPKRGLL